MCGCVHVHTYVVICAGAFPRTQLVSNMSSMMNGADNHVHICFTVIYYTLIFVISDSLSVSSANIVSHTGM